MNEHETIQQVILDLYAAFANSDEVAFRNLTHPQVRTVNIGNSNEVHVFDQAQITEFTIGGLKKAKEQIPGFFAHWETIKFHQITVHEAAASAEVSYQMEMPDSTGFHNSNLHLVKEKDRWLVINIIDRGLEEPKDD